MAKIKYGILGPLSGKLGSLIGGSWKGIPYVRMNKEADIQRNRSAAQLSNQYKFKYVNDWMVPFQPYLNIGFEHLAIGKTALAAALSANYSTAFTGMHPDFILDYAKFQISTGKLPGLLNVQIAFSEPDTIQLNWNQNAVKGTSYNDQLMLVLYSAELEECDGFIGGVGRSKQAYQFVIKEDMSAKPLHAYLSLTSIDRRKIANSVYLGLINP